MSTPASPATQAKGGRGRSIAIGIIVIIIILAAAYYALYGMGSPTSSTTKTITPTQIMVPNGTAASGGSLNFSPQNITVVMGTNNTIVWKNNDVAAHTITFTSAPSGVTASSLSDSSDLGAGTSYTVTLTTPGTYHYKCSIHPWMVGTITVLAG
jgi:plastocyanin